MIAALVLKGLVSRFEVLAHEVEGKLLPQSAERPAKRQEGQGPMKKYNGRQCRGAETLRLYRNSNAV